MHTSESYSVRYQTTPHLSARVSSGSGSLPTQSERNRTNQTAQGSRSFRLDLPSYSGFPARQVVSPSMTMQGPTITLNRGTQPTAMESPRLMREKQKELIARAQLSSKLAASPLSAKPEAPRIDPLEGPQGPVTPLALEEQESLDYFGVADNGRFSPATSPGARSSRSSVYSNGEKLKKLKHKMDIY